MAQQCGPVFITGTIDDVCFYRMDGKYYVRMKSSLTRKRVMKDPAFRRTREYAALLGTASKTASRVYRLITGERRKHALYREMTGKAMRLFREGRDTEAVFLCLCNQYLEREPAEMPAPLKAESSKPQAKVPAYCLWDGPKSGIGRFEVQCLKFQVPLWSIIHYRPVPHHVRGQPRIHASFVMIERTGFCPLAPF